MHIPTVLAQEEVYIIWRRQIAFGSELRSKPVFILLQI